MTSRLPSRRRSTGAISPAMPRMPTTDCANASLAQTRMNRTATMRARFTTTLASYRHLSRDAAAIELALVLHQLRPPRDPTFRRTYASWRRDMAVGGEDSLSRRVCLSACFPKGVVRDSLWETHK